MKLVVSRDEHGAGQRLEAGWRRSLKLIATLRGLFCQLKVCILIRLIR